ncbi:MAG TPA: 3-isopropylmalate dehydratase small subunit [Caulifigura sp.]|jgi:3-isopropylmalate/(R)-2-methylmalate dehydratase small subunit|nr:3-isopropylmalate dehydratase small subunit [Caulifigura sp.]
MQKIDSIRGRAIPLVLDDIDTDRIIPARYLRCVTFDGLGQYAFEDDRKQDPQHPFNDARFQGANVLIAGRNFGCGSSREHAPQSLMRWGIKGIVAESYAEIFFGNCNSLGIPAVRASRENLEKLAAAVRAEPNTEVVLDLTTLTVTCGSIKVPVEMPEAVKESLVSGQWDFLGQLLDGAAAVEKTAEKIPYMQFAK